MLFEHQQIIILDTEYTTWEGCSNNGWDINQDQYREIVQIASLLVDTRTFDIIDTFKSLIRPQINPNLSDYFVSLTGITQDEITDEKSFLTAANSFLSWAGKHRIYAWGNEYDIMNENVELCNADTELPSEQFRDIRLLLNQKSIPVENYTSGTVQKHFDISTNKSHVHDAMYDCFSLLRALRNIADDN